MAGRVLFRKQEGEPSRLWLWYEELLERRYWSLCKSNREHIRFNETESIEDVKVPWWNKKCYLKHSSQAAKS